MLFLYSNGMSSCNQLSLLFHLSPAQGQSLSALRPGPLLLTPAVTQARFLSAPVPSASTANLLTGTTCLKRPWDISNMTTYLMSLLGRRDRGWSNSHEWFHYAREPQYLSECGLWGHAPPISLASFDYKPDSIRWAISRGLTLLEWLDRIRQSFNLWDRVLERLRRRFHW